jgi:hypothetical protein
VLHNARFLYYLKNPKNKVLLVCHTDIVLLLLYQILIINYDAEQFFSQTIWGIPQITQPSNEVRTPVIRPSLNNLRTF